ncbi:unnamed protein product [Sympodiomycopsis kandeliae]
MWSQVRWSEDAYCPDPKPIEAHTAKSNTSQSTARRTESGNLSPNITCTITQDKMRLFALFSIFALVLLLVASPAKAWEPEDHEIFELQAALEESSGKGTTFYSILNLTAKATAQQIKTAYRKRSVELHPDKHPDNPKAAKRFEQLGLVNKILRDARKDRYDHFLTTGFPKWRGTGYFYERFRPGLGSVVIGLVIFTSLIELLVRKLNYTRDQLRLATIRRNAFYQAWGPKFYHVLFKSPGAPSAPAEKRVKLSLGSLLDLPSPSAEQAVPNVDELEKQVRKVAAQGSASQSPLLASAGRSSIDVLVTREDDGEGIVWTLDDETGEWTELTEKNLIVPSLSNAWPVKLAKHLTARFNGQKPQQSAEEDVTATTTGTASATEPDTASVKNRKNNKKK